MKVPTRIIGLDWETYYDDDYTLKKLSTTAYVRDVRFLIYGAAVQWNTWKHPRWMLWDQLRAYLDTIDWRNTALLAHHTHFDGLILTHHLKHKPAYYYDTLSMGRALYGMETGAGLDALARHMGLGAKHETYLDAVKGVRKPTKRALKTLGDGAKIDCDLTWQLFRKMLPEFPSDELDLIHYTVKCYAEPLIKIDKELALKLHKKVVRDRKKLLRRVNIWQLTDWKASTPPKGYRFTHAKYEELATSLRSRKQFPEMLRALDVEPPLKISQSWINKPVEERDPAKKYTYAFAANDLAFLALKEHPDPRVRELVEAKLLCSSSIHETKPLRMIEHADPAFPVYLNYWGARNTGRWSGGDKVNSQALSRESGLRKTMKAPKGYKFVLGDSRAIEAVMNGWLANDWELMEQFADKASEKRGEDPYTLLASAVYNRRITKKDKVERFVGKVGTLGLGYQMGEAKLRYTFETGTLGPVLVLPVEMYKEIKDTYRRQRKPIVNQWWYFNDLLPKMMQAGFEEEYRGCVTFGHESIELPNEMLLQYPNLRFKMNEDEHGNASEDVVYRKNTKLYGGKLVENVIQAISRVVIGQQYLRIADKYRMVLLAHDEIVLLVRSARAKQAAHDLLETLRLAPSWCKDAPLDGEVGVFDEYTKM